MGSELKPEFFSEYYGVLEEVPGRMEIIRYYGGIPSAKPLFVAIFIDL